MPDDSRPLSPAGDEPASGPAATPRSDGHDDADKSTTWAGNRSLDSRWWWSPALMIVVGVCVIGYQSGPIRTGEAIAMNWVMVVVGAAVAVAGLVSLGRAHAEERSSAATTRDQPPAGPSA